MSGLLAPTKKEIFLGYASIKQVFNISKVGKVAGCLVTEGKVERGAKVRLLRDKVVIHEGTLSILKRFKDEVREVPVARSAAWHSRTTKTSAKATKSSASRSRRSSAPSKSLTGLFGHWPPANDLALRGAPHLRRVALLPESFGLEVFSQ